MPKVHLIEGPVGSGKSTFADALARRTGGVHIALDAWFARLFSPDRPATGLASWYHGRKERLLTLIWEHSRHLLAARTEVILELGLIQRQNRTAFCRQVRNEGFEIVVHVLDAPRHIRRERVQLRNATRGPTYAMTVPEDLFELASDLWEEPDDMERSEFAVETTDTSAPRSDGHPCPAPRRKRT